MFFSQETKERFYPGPNLKIDSVTVLLLIAYNQTKDGELFDGRFIYFLLVSILTAEEKKKKKVDKGKLKFAREIFEFRVRNAANSAERLEKFDLYAKNKIEDIRDKTKKFTLPKRCN